MKTEKIALVTNGAAVAAFVALVWLPEISAYWVPNVSPDSDQQERARFQPADAILDEIARQRFGMPDKPEALGPVARQYAIQRADNLLSGQVAFADEPPTAVSVPFESSNLSRGSPAYQLHVASMGTVDIMLDAYQATGRRRYLDAAMRELSAFDRVDRWSLIPRGLLWNDHALANRMSIIAHMWRVIRRGSLAEPRFERELLSFASRTAARLAKPNLFTYRTNHGVMQNLALLQYAAAFPSLIDAADMKELACKRLEEQLRYYVSPEGVVLEHSAGYQEFGLDLLEIGNRLAAITGCSAAAALKDALLRVSRVSRLLRRPDGSLPVYGNTDHQLRIVSAPDGAAVPDVSAALLPASGLSVWWSGLEKGTQSQSLSQTVVTWSAFPTGAHKHADEMSVVIWAQDQQLLGGTGYWPYSTPGYGEAQGWRSSNAPHFVGEPARSTRYTRLLGAAQAQRVRSIHLERELDDGSRLRRRVIEIDGRAWIIVDSVDSSRTLAVERLWTLPPEVAVRPIGERAFRLTGSARSGARLSLLGDVAGSPTVIQGSLDPFGGWIVRNSVPVAAPAIVVRQAPRRSLLVTVIEADPDPRRFEQEPLPQLASGSDTEQGHVMVRIHDGPVEAVWERRHLELRFGDGSLVRLSDTAETAAVDQVRLATIAAYESTAQRYPRFREITAYRYKLSYLGLVLLVLQEFTAWAVRRLFAQYLATLRLLATLSWLAVGLYASLWYLQ